MDRIVCWNYNISVIGEMLGDFTPDSPMYTMAREEPCEVCGKMDIPSYIRGHKVCGTWECIRIMQKRANFEV